MLPIDADQVPAILQDWTAELNGAVDEGLFGQLAVDLILLAKRGRDRQVQLYNWYEPLGPEGSPVIRGADAPAPVMTSHDRPKSAGFAPRTGHSNEFVPGPGLALRG